MFKSDPGTTFSDIWYRVAATRPKLSPHAQVVRQQFGTQITYIIEEPAGGQFYRLSESAYFFLGLLDGHVTVGEAWDACNVQMGDAAPTQRECIEALGKLQLFGLLLGDLPLAADMVLERKRQVRSRRLMRRTGKGMFLSLPLFNPEPFLDRYAHLIRPLFSRWAFVLWLLVVIAGATVLLANLREFGTTLDTAALLDPRNLVWLTVIFLVLRAVHELAHAASCKAMGGRSTEIGVLLIAWVLPLPYCDATSAWRFPEVWRRVLVSSAGIMAELFIAGLAAFVWTLSRDGDGLARTLAYNTILVSGITTIVFNLNPLLRYDGYYILSDLTGVPNLAQRSREVWQYLIDRFAFGVRGVRPPVVRGNGEAWLLIWFGALSWPYRILVAVSIIWLISGRYVTLGAVLAVIVAAAWLLWPMLKGVGYLLSSPRLLGRRGRAVGVTAGFVAALLAVLGLVPVSAAGYAIGTVEPTRLAGVRAPEGGFVREVLVGAGDRVEAGAPLLVLENAQLEVEAAMAEARYLKARAMRDEKMLKSPAERQVAEVHLAAAELGMKRARQRVESLVVRSPITGRLAPAQGTGVDLRNLVGRFAGRGTLLALVADTDQLVIRAVLSDQDRAYVFRGGQEEHESGWPRPSVRIRGAVRDELGARIVRVGPAGIRELDNPALATTAGGDVALDPTDPEGRRTLASQYMVELQTERPPPGAQPGLRARVRFGVPPEPLLTQWWREARQLFSARVLR